MIRISMEVPGGNLVFDRRKYKFKATKIVHVKPVALVFFFSSFLVFEGCAYIYGFLITWGMPFQLCSHVQWQRFYFGVFYLDSSWKRVKEGKCWPEDFSVVSLLFKDVLISYLGSGGSACIQTFFSNTLVGSDLEQQRAGPRISR